MALVVKGNTEFTIPEEKVKEYLEMGYSQIDYKGKVIQNGNPKTPDDYNHLVSELKAKVDMLTAANFALTEENKKLKAEAKASAGKKTEKKPRKKTAKAEG